MTYKEAIKKAREKYPLRALEKEGSEAFNNNQKLRRQGYIEFFEDMFMKDCPECDGEGQFYEDTRGSCTVYRGDCCGGCGYDVDCENCNGTGLIEKEEEDV